jgi:hypothetical protein
MPESLYRPREEAAEVKLRRLEGTEWLGFRL